MKKIHSSRTRKILRLATPLALLPVACPTSRAVELGEVSVHGSVSATASYSPEYNYLGDTKDRLDLNQTELILNGARRFDNGLKIAAQLYAYELDGFNDLTVDFANVDYDFSQSFGVRLGRNKLPLGFYNDVQDLDQVRVFASLPLNFYPRAVRPFVAVYDGGALYGNINAHRAGSFDYQVFAGTIQPLDKNLPFMRGVRADKFDIGFTYGAALVWNTPVEGLRFGYTVQGTDDMRAESGPVKLEMDYYPQVFSAEYSRGKWVATAEYKYVENSQLIRIPGFPPFVPPSTIRQSNTERQTYLQLTYAATDKIGLGVYYSYADFGVRGVDRDLAFATCYALQPWWLLKGEVHLMDGIANLGHAADSNPGASDDTWTYFVLKTTISF